MGTVLSFRDDDRQPRAEIALGNGDRIGVSLDGDGLILRQTTTADAEILFRADEALVGRICAGLVETDSRLSASPLRIVVAVVLQLRSAEQVRDAFRTAAARIS